jgi:hypothetical protein
MFPLDEADAGGVHTVLVIASLTRNNVSSPLSSSQPPAKRAHEFNIYSLCLLDKCHLPVATVSLCPARAGITATQTTITRPITETVAMRLLVRLFADQTCAWTVLRLLRDLNKNYGNLAAFAG